MNYIDLILLVIVGFVVYISVKNGFFKTLFDLIAYVVAIAAAKNISPLLAKSAFDTMVRDGAQEYLTTALSGIGTEQLPEQAEKIMASIPDGLRGLLDIIGFTEEKISEQISSIELNGQDIVTGIMDKVVEPIGVGIMQFLIFVVLGIILLVAAKIIVKLLDGVVKRLPVIKRFNSLLGGVVGFVKGAVIAAVFACILGVVASVSDNQSFIESVGNSIILNSFTETIGDFSF